MAENYENLKHEVNIMSVNMNKLTKMYNRMEMDYIVLKNDNAELRDAHIQTKKEVQELRDQYRLQNKATNLAS